MRGDDTIKRQLEQRQTEEKRQWSGSTPTEDLMERALEHEGDEDEAAARQDEARRP